MSIAKQNTNTDKDLMKVINTATQFVLARVKVPDYIDLQDLCQEVSMTVVQHLDLEQDCINRLAEHHVGRWLNHENELHEITMSSAEAAAARLDVRFTRSQYENLSRRGVEQLLETLSAKQREVVCLRYGIHCAQCHNAADVAAVLGITKDLVMDLEDQALSAMLNATHSSNLNGFLLLMMR